jgi:predicted nucleic-acid-binding Zn-ribbon protein
MLTINYYQRYTNCITCRCKEVAEGEVAAGMAQGKEV